MTITRCGLALLGLVSGSCTKVDIEAVDARFDLADAAWFADEDTLFVFYEARAEQGIGEPSVLELAWETDAERRDWTPINELDTVHEHVPVDCGPNALCGSTSVVIPDEPRNVRVRLRYHRDSTLALDASVQYNVVGSGAAHTNRSFLVYGVFDETNTMIQWRGRHRFPTIRNEKASELGLRRVFDVDDVQYGSRQLAGSSNPYGYGVRCPSDFEDAQLDAVTTSDRAVFQSSPLPVEAGAARLACGQATVEDGTGAYTTGAIAQKNPEVRPAFPSLKSPIRDAQALNFFLGPCDRVINRRHERMQRQRLQMEDTPTTCTDDWRDSGFTETLVAKFDDAIADARPSGDDMVLAIGLHQDEPGLVSVVEDALAEVLPAERHRSSPRVAGAFVFDSTARGLGLDELKPTTLWCPATFPTTGQFPDASARTCAIMPDIPDLELGPLTFGTLPILPERDAYLDFLSDYSEAQAGQVLSLTYRVPEFAVTADHIDLGEFGVVTFLNEELISAGSADAFSYCPKANAPSVVFRSPILRDVESASFLDEACEAGALPDFVCESVDSGALPLQYLPAWHANVGETDYELGIFWDFPFLLRMRFESSLAGSVSAFGLSVPFGVARSGRQFLGTSFWTTDAFPLRRRLTQCTRFCDHPTFDDASVYSPGRTFRGNYLRRCYRPDYPELTDGGFPRDP